MLQEALNCTVMGPMAMQIKHWALTENLTVFMILGVDGGIGRGATGQQVLTPNASTGQ